MLNMLHPLARRRPRRGRQAAHPPVPCQGPRRAAPSVTCLWKPTIRPPYSAAGAGMARRRAASGPRTGAGGWSWRRRLSAYRAGRTNPFRRDWLPAI